MTMGMTACSSEGDDILGGNGSEQPKETSGVRVTVSAGISDGEGTTRSTVEMDGSTRTLKFTAGDKLYVWKEVGEPGNPVIYMAGMLDMVGDPSADGLSATFTGEVMGYDKDENEYDCDAEGDPLVGTEATLVHAGLTEDEDYNIDPYSRTIDFGDWYAADVETLMTKWLKVTGNYENGGYTLQASNLPIIYCSLSGLEAFTEYDVSLQYPSVYGYYQEGGGSFTTDAYGAGTVAFEARDNGTHEWQIAISIGNATVGIISLGERELAAKVYNVSRQWTGSCFAKLVSGTVNLATVTDNILAQDGTTLTGTLGAGYKVTIAAGATVTFSNMTVGPTDEYSDGEYSGIDCAGDANIILVGTNIVRAYGRPEAGIFIREGSTLTIDGTGSLTTVGGIENAGGGGAGIGGYYIFDGENGVNCGNIVIKGGTVTAWGGCSSAGIGGGYKGSCGNITINGGTVTATSGGIGPAGIGSEGNGSCGDITISGGTVTATGGQNGAGIGSGNNSSCGDITIDSGIASVTAVVGPWGGEDNPPKPIGEGTNSPSLDTVTFGGVTFDWHDLNSETYYYYGALTLSITSVNVGEPPYYDDWRTVWTLTP